MANELIPISDEQAKAAQEVAKMVTEAIRALSGIGGFIDRALGTTPEDFVGWLFGDRLRIRRAINFAETARKAEEIMRQRGANSQHIPLPIAIPLAQGAAEEDRPELQDLWAKLLAAAADPTRSDRVRQSFIEAVKRMEPIDAKVLTTIPLHANASPNTRDLCAMTLNITTDRVEVSFENLILLGLIAKSGPGSTMANLTPTGREFMRACEA